ncbi:MAG: NERD domain-containing protein [Ruminococcaceae bacterium]|nr:NERD domain-containing protein [Oscillospiraceae bacterium]
MILVLSGAFKAGTVIALIILALAAVGILFYLIPEIKKYSRVNELNSKENRDKRFAASLLSVYFKDSVIESPYLLRSDKDCSPCADVIVVCEGGIIVLTVEDRPGYFDTPKTGAWTWRQEETLQKIPNPFDRGMYYVGACSNIAKRNGISCPIYNLVLLSNDEVEYSGSSGDGVLTNDVLVACVKKIKDKRKMSTADAQMLVRLIKQNGAYYKKLFVSDDFDDEPSSFDDGPAPVIRNIFSDDEPSEDKPAKKDSDDVDISW